MGNALQQKTSVLLAKAFTRWPVLGRLWSKVSPIARSTDIPWTSLTKPLTGCRITLITTGGLHLRTDQPFNMDDPKGDPTFRVIPADAEHADLTITHNYYNHVDADRDSNILLPLDRVKELTRGGYVSGLTPSHYSFMGHIDGPHVATLENEILPVLLRKIHSEHPDFVFLTPA